MPLPLLALIGAGLVKGAAGVHQREQATVAGGGGMGALTAMLLKRRLGEQPTEGAALPNNPIMQPQHFNPSGMTQIPQPEMRPGGFGAMPGGPNIGPGMDPSMTPPQDESGYSPVPPSGRRRPTLNRWGF